MAFIFWCFWFLVGVTVAIWIGAQMYLPVLYNLPVATYLFIKKRIKFRAIIYQFIPPIIWCFLLIVFGLVMQMIFPSFKSFIETNAGFAFGQIIGTIYLLTSSLLTRKGRADLWDDFTNSTYRHYALDKYFAE